ncbi:hypothetical protein BDF19DRAFT_257697 [Syncephalis fuscata]|nr:hypothetical protein BDF19DRAFT_257697 [Syncephalis fuscata]
MNTATPPQTVPLVTDRVLLNPQFDGYQLSILPDQAQSQQWLPRPVQPILLSSQVDITYGEMRSRACYNHLFQGPQYIIDGKKEALFYYIDNDGWLMAIRLGESALMNPVVIEPLFQMPASTSSILPDQIEHYPSVVYYGQWIVVSNGKGQLFLLEWYGQQDTPAQLIKKWTYLETTAATTEPICGLPCTVLDMTQVPATKQIQLLILTMNKIDRNQQHLAEDQQKQVKKSFFINLISLDPCNNIPSAIMDYQLEQQIESHDPPTYAYFDKADTYIVGGRMPFTLVSSKSEEAAITDLASEGPPPPPPQFISSSLPSYSWTQTENDQELTIYIVLSRCVMTQQIQCEFTPTAIHIDVLDGLDPLLWMQHRTLYDRIRPTECLWTLESGRLLTLHLQREGKSTGGLSRWPHVFADDDGVLETLDPSALAEIRDQLEKLTTNETASAIRARQPPMTHVFSDPLEAEDEEGETVSFYRVSNQATTPAITHCIKPTGQDWLGLGARLPLDISISANLSNINVPSRLPAICLRQDIDGLVYELSGEHILHAQHAATFDAFGFVQASKRDRRFIVFSALAQYIVVVETRQRLFVYRRAPTRHSPHAIQYVVNLADDMSDILGVQAVDTLNEQILILTEKGLHCITLTKQE